MQLTALGPWPTTSSLRLMRRVVFALRTGAQAAIRGFRKAIDGVQATAEQLSALRAVWITHILSARRR